jgi:hypothetical protein
MLGGNKSAFLQKDRAKFRKHSDDSKILVIEKEQQSADHKTWINWFQRNSVSEELLLFR